MCVYYDLFILLLISICVVSIFRIMNNPGRGANGSVLLLTADSSALQGLRLTGGEGSLTRVKGDMQCLGLIACLLVESQATWTFYLNKRVHE